MNIDAQWGLSASKKYTGLQLCKKQKWHEQLKMLSVSPSENLQGEISIRCLWPSWQSEAKDERAFKRATPTPENLSAVGPLSYLTTPSLLPRRQYLTGSHHRTLVRFRSLRTGNPACHMGSAPALLHAQSKSGKCVGCVACSMGIRDTGLHRRDVIEDLREIDKQRKVALLEFSRFAGSTVSDLLILLQITTTY